MCPPLRAKISGANVLPFGLTTDVSAGALAAGGALGAGAAGGAVTGPGTEETVFANTLKAVAEPGNRPEAATAAAGAPGEVRLSAPVGAADEAIDLLKAAAGTPVPQAAGPADPVEGAQAGPDPAPLSPEAAAPQAGEPSAEQAAEAVLADGAAVAAAPIPTLLSFSEAGSVPAAASASAAVVAAAGAAGQGVPGGMLPGAPGGQAPVPSGMVNPNAADGLQQAAAAASGRTGAPAAAGAEATPAAGRRWQNELPQELRAPALPSAQGRGTAQPAPAAAAPLGAHGGAALPVTAAGNLTGAGSPVGEAAAGLPLTAQAVTGKAGQTQTGIQTQTQTQAATPVQAQATVPQAAQAQTAPAQPVSVAVLPGEAAPASATVRPQVAQTAAQVPGDGPSVAGQSQTAAAGQSIASPTPAAGAAGHLPAQPLAQQPLQSAEAPALQPSSDALPVEPLADGETVPVKAGPETSASPAAAKPAGGAPAQAAQGADPRSAGTGPAAAQAAADADVPVEDVDLVLPHKLEGGAGADFTTASIRGGDLNGAVRTESLQTPNQTQSSHVATQVAAEIARTLKDGQTRFQMRFDPPELGRVDVKMRVGADGSVQAHLIVDRPETLDMFLRDQRGLERALEAAGLNAGSDNLQFSLKQDGGQDFGSNQGEGGEPSAFGDDGTDELADSEQGLTDRVRLMLAEQRGGLDMKV